MTRHGGFGSTAAPGWLAGCQIWMPPAAGIQPVGGGRLGGSVRSPARPFRHTRPRARLFGVGGSSVATPVLALLGAPALIPVASPLPATISSSAIGAVPYLRSGEAHPRASPSGCCSPPTGSSPTEADMLPQWGWRPKTSFRLSGKPRQTLTPSIRRALLHSEDNPNGSRRPHQPSASVSRRTRAVSTRRPAETEYASRGPNTASSRRPVATGCCQPLGRFRRSRICLTRKEATRQW